MTVTAPTGLRQGIVYGYRVRHPDTGEIVLGYVGQTRWLEVRDGQHRGDERCLGGQPWADTIVGDIFVIDCGDWPDEVLDARELALIGQLRPLYNVIGNRRNPHRIEPWVAQRQRRTRDRKAGRPLWQPHPATVTSPRPHARPRPRERKPAPFRINWRAVILAQVWIVVTGGLAWASGGQWRLSLATSTGIFGAVIVYRWIRRMVRKVKATFRRRIRHR